METGSSGHHSPVGPFHLTGHLVPQSAKVALLGRSAPQDALATIATRALSLVSCLTRRSGSQNDVLAASRPLGRRAAARRVGIVLADVSESGRTPEKVKAGQHRDGGTRLTRRAARHGRSARRQPSLPATARCRRCGPPALVGGPADPGSTAPSPAGSEAGVAPAQPRPAAKPASRHRHGPLLAGRCGPSSSLYPATAA